MFSVCTRVPTVVAYLFPADFRCISSRYLWQFIRFQRNYYNRRNSCYDNIVSINQYLLLQRSRARACVRVCALVIICLMNDFVAVITIIIIKSRLKSTERKFRIDPIIKCNTCDFYFSPLFELYGFILHPFTCI